VTEGQWLSCTDPTAMLAFLAAAGKTDERRLRLFAAACYRRVWHLLTDQRSREAVEAGESFADGLIGEDALWDALDAAWGAAEAAGTAARKDESSYPLLAAANAAANVAVAYHYTASTPAGYAAKWASSSTADAAGELARGGNGAGGGFQRVCAEQAPLVRDIFNPFHPMTLDASSLTPAVVALATVIYESRSFDRLPELAQALADAGCTDAELLGHLCSAGPNCLGCWGLDAVLGKG
jgi:hypothetical protein